MKVHLNGMENVSTLLATAGQSNVVLCPINILRDFDTAFVSYKYLRRH